MPELKMIVQYKLYTQANIYWITILSVQFRQGCN